MWRYTGMPVRLFVLDGRACLPLLVVIVKWTWLNLYIAVSGTLFFAMISWFGLSVPVVARMVRRWLAGRVRPAVPVWHRRRLA